MTHQTCFYRDIPRRFQTKQNNIPSRTEASAEETELTLVVLMAPCLAPVGFPARDIRNIMQPYADSDYTPLPASSQTDADKYQLTALAFFRL